MENLVGRKVKCIQEHESIPMTKGKSYVIVEDDGSLISFRINRKGMFGICSHKDLKEKEYFELLPNEPQFKQGDKVLWSGGKLKDERGIFICKYENYFIVKHIGDEYDLENGTLKYAEKIKPYEEEIKVGDWVKVNNEQAIIKINEIGIKYLDNYTKITDEVLINKLNEL